MSSTERRRTPTPTPIQHLAASAEQQHGHVDRRQARSAGMSDAQIRRRVREGSLVRVGPRGLRVNGTPTSALAEVHGLLLDIGGDVWATGPTAAAILGFDGFSLAPPYHFIVPRGRYLERRPHRVRTTIDLPLIDRAVHLGLPVTSGARTLIELARTATTEQLTRALDSGLRDGRFSEDLLHSRIVALRSSGRHGIPRLLEVIDGAEVTRGGHSWLEREYLRLVAASGLPRPETQVTLGRAGTRMIRVDFRFPGTNVIVEVLGYRFHRSKDQMRRDAERLNALMLKGYLVLQHTYDQVVNEPDSVIAQLREALGGAHGGRGAPVRYPPPGSVSARSA